MDTFNLENHHLALKLALDFHGSSLIPVQVPHTPQGTGAKTGSHGRSVLSQPACVQVPPCPDSYRGWCFPNERLTSREKLVLIM